jgi:hypothetical protein
MELLSQSKYAKLRGVSQQYISKLIQQGKLHAEPNGKINPEKANAELDYSTGAYREPTPVRRESEPTKQEAAKPKQNIPKINNNDVKPADNTNKKPSYYEARAANEIIKAKIHKVEYDKLVGSLLPREEVEKVFFDTGREIRDHLLSITDRISPLIAAESDLHKCTQLLKTEIHSVLESMSNAFGK